MLSTNWMTRDKVRTLSDRQKLILISALTRTSAAGVAQVGQEELAWIVGNGCTSADVQAVLEAGQKLGLVEYDSQTSEVFFLDFFRYEKFYGKGWAILQKAVDKIESARIRRLADQARPARPIDDHHKPDQPSANRPRVQIPVIE